jgi:hypothetical protein
MAACIVSLLNGLVVVVAKLAQTLDEDQESLVLAWPLSACLLALSAARRCTQPTAHLTIIRASALECLMALYADGEAFKQNADPLFQSRQLWARLPVDEHYRIVKTCLILFKSPQTDQDEMCVALSILSQPGPFGVALDIAGVMDTILDALAVILQPQMNKAKTASLRLRWAAIGWTLNYASRFLKQSDLQSAVATSDFIANTSSLQSLTQALFDDAALSPQGFAAISHIAARSRTAHDAQSPLANK